MPKTLIKKLDLPTTFSQLSVNAIAGLIIGLNAIIGAVSYSAFVYSGQLTEYFSLGFIMVLTGAAIVMTITALFSSLPIAIAEAQDESLAVFSIMAASVASMLAAQHSTDSVLSTVFISVGMATAITGILFIILGVLKIGNLVSFMPYPVVGGFLAGIGWFLFSGSFTVLVPTLNGVSALFADGMVLLHWLPALIYAILLIKLTEGTHHPLQWPSLILGGVVLFYAVVFVFKIPMSDVRDQGYLLNLAKSGGKALSVHSIDLHHIAWYTVFSQITNMLAISLLSTIAILFNATGLEVSLKKDINFNRELCVAGVGNFLSSLVGGITGYMTVTDTMLNYKTQHGAASHSRLAGLFAALICIVGIFIGLTVLAYVPRLLVGSLLMYFGMSFLKHWVYDIRKTLPWPDFVIIISILLVIAIVGLLQGILAGILISIGFFVVKYSHISVVKSMLKGDYLHSNKQRDPDTQKILQKYSTEILYFQLQNFLFFGNANALLKKLQDRFKHFAEVKYIIYDFSHLTGLDCSATVSFEKIKQLAEKKKVLIFLTDVDHKIYELLEKSNVITEGSALKVFQTCDSALEWCEDDILEKKKITSEQVFSLEIRLREYVSDNQAIGQFKNYFEKVALSKDSYLFRQGDPSSELYYIESGQVTIYLEGHQKIRLRTIGPGNIVGEIALYIHQPRSASVIVEQDCVLQKLTLAKIEEMKKQAPHLAVAFDGFIIQTLAERLIYANKQVELLRK